MQLAYPLQQYPWHDQAEEHGIKPDFEMVGCTSTYVCSNVPGYQKHTPRHYPPACHKLSRQLLRSNHPCNCLYRTLFRLDRSRPTTVRKV